MYAFIYSFLCSFGASPSAFSKAIKIVLGLLSCMYASDAAFAATAPHNTPHKKETTESLITITPLGLGEPAKIDLEEFQGGPKCNPAPNFSSEFRFKPCGLADVNFMLVSNHTKDLTLDISASGGDMQVVRVCIDECAPQDTYSEQLKKVTLRAQSTLNVSMRLRTFSDWAFSQFPRVVDLYVKASRDAPPLGPYNLLRRSIAVTNTPFEWSARRYGPRISVRGTVRAANGCGNAFLTRQEGKDNLAVLSLKTGIALPKPSKSERRFCTQVEKTLGVKRSVLDPTDKKQRVVVEHKSGKQITLPILDP